VVPGGFQIDEMVEWIFLEKNIATVARTGDICAWTDRKFVACSHKPGVHHVCVVDTHCVLYC